LGKPTSNVFLATFKGRVLSILTLALIALLSVGPRPLSDTIWLANAPMIVGETPLVIRDHSEEDGGIELSPEVIATFAADNEVAKLIFLDDLFSTNVELSQQTMAITDLDGKVRRMRVEGVELTIPPISRFVPSISTAQLIQLRPDSLTGAFLLIAGEAGESELHTLSGDVPLWQAYAQATLTPHWRSASATIVFASSLLLFLIISLSRKTTIAVTLVFTAVGMAAMCWLAWLPPADPILIAVTGGLLIARLSHLQNTNEKGRKALTKLEIDRLSDFGNKAVVKHDCLAAWVVMREIKPSAPPANKIISQHGDTGAMSHERLTSLLDSHEKNQTHTGAWSVYEIATDRTLEGALFLVTQPNDRHNRHSVANIARMIASFCVTDSEPND